MSNSSDNAGANNTNYFLTKQIEKKYRISGLTCIICLAVNVICVVDYWNIFAVKSCSDLGSEISRKQSSHLLFCSFYWKFSSAILEFCGHVELKSILHIWQRFRSPERKPWSLLNPGVSTFWSRCGGCWNWSRSRSRSIQILSFQRNCVH